MKDTFKPGDPVRIQDARGDWYDAIADSSVEGTHRDGRKIHDFPVVPQVIGKHSNQGANTMSRPAIKIFSTERELTDYATALNDAGIEPDIAIMDSAGFSMLACMTAPGGDGWGFAYYHPNTDEGTIQGEYDGGWVKPTRSVDEYGQGKGWEPAWPVFGLVAAL